MVEIEIDFTKSAQDNANDYFAKAKKAKRKAEGAEQAVKDLEKKLASVEAKAPQPKVMKKIEEKEWYEKFHWFFTSNGVLAIGGKSADQNELINSKHFLEGDLFFHAEVFGADVVVLKGGENAPREIKEEVAQFAACHSKAWQDGASSATVYSLKRDQVSKSSQKGYLSKGGFALSGEREWYRNVPLELCAVLQTRKKEVREDMGEDVKRVSVVPKRTLDASGEKHYLLIKPGKSKKSDAAKFIAKSLGYDDVDKVMQLLPAGDFSISRNKT